MTRSSTTTWPDIIEWGATVFIADEAQRYKNGDAKRAKALLELADDAATAHRVAPLTNLSPVTVMLTGTLAMNKPDEVYQPARITGRSTVKALTYSDSYDAFARKWCIREPKSTPNGIKYTVTGCTDAPALHDALRSSSYLRVTREDVLDMPPKVWSVKGVTLDDSVLRTYRRIEKEFLAWVAEMMGDKAAARMAKGEAICRLQKLWEYSARAKAVEAAEYVAALVDQGEQVVVMANHREVVSLFRTALRTHKVRDGFKERSIRSVELVGGMTKKNRTETMDVFKAGRVEVLVGNHEAAGVGHNIECASHLVFLQLPWSPGSMVQVSDRIYRQTSKKLCTIHILNALGTVEEKMYDMIQTKAAVTDVINSGEYGIAIPQDISVEGELLASYGWDA